MIVNVIHDRQRADRRILLDSEIKEHGLQVRYWDAIKDPVMSFRGINLAHKQIVRDALVKKLPMVCIAEDDLHLTGPGAFRYFMEHIPTDFDLFLGGIYCGTIKPDNSVEDFCSLTLYIVHERFYVPFLGIDEKVHLDRGLARKGRFIVCNPFCALQHPGWSDNKRGYYDYGYLIQQYQDKGFGLCCNNVQL
jgi:hypothetical protein